MPIIRSGNGLHQSCYWWMVFCPKDLSCLILILSSLQKVIFSAFRRRNCERKLKKGRKSSILQISRWAIMWCIVSTVSVNIEGLKQLKQRESIEITLKSTMREQIDCSCQRTIWTNCKNISVMKVLRQSSIKWAVKTG